MLASDQTRATTEMLASVSSFQSDPSFLAEGIERKPKVLIVDALDINRRLLRAML